MSTAADCSITCAPRGGNNKRWILSGGVLFLILFVLGVFGMLAWMLHEFRRSNGQAEIRRALAERQRSEIVQAMRQLVARMPAQAPPIEPAPPAVRYVVYQEPPATAESPPRQGTIHPPSPDADADSDLTVVSARSEVLAALSETDDREPIAGRTIQGGFEALGIRRKTS